MAKIGIFGGSFNPPHPGHVLAMEEFQKALSLDRILVIPAGIPPHKELTPQTPSPEDRLEMTRLAVASLPYAEVCDLELKRQGASYTADTLRLLRQRFAKDELFLLMGTDMFLSFDRWYRPEYIASQATLAVAHRDADNLNRLQAWQEKLRADYQCHSCLISNTYLPHSSTSVRALLAFDCAESYVDPAVLAYIKERGLYYTGRNLKELPFEELSAVSLSLHKAKRIPHVIGCSQMAGELARRYGENETDAIRAGILHDVTKALNGEEQLQICRRYDMILNDFERTHPKLLHAKTGAAVAKWVFGENDRVYEAIKWHTTGKADMSALEKIIYLADYTEQNRDFEGVEVLRELARTDLNRGMCMGLRMTMDQLLSQGRDLDPNSVAALYCMEGRNSDA